MATFKTCVKQDKQRKDGFYQVFIRVIHNRKIAYIPTDKYVNERGLYKGEVEDPFVLQYCLNRITQWMDKLNHVDAENWTVKEVVEYVKNDSNDVSFSEYANKYVEALENEGRSGTAHNFRYAVVSIEKFAATKNLMFSQMTTAFLERWIAWLSSMNKSVKQKYPTCIRAIYKKAMIDLNNEERGVERIKFNPWPRVRIPKPEAPKQLAISPTACREFFNAPLPDSRLKTPGAELGRDVALMVLCLGGINTVDLFNLKKKDYYNGILHYNRTKTRSKRLDGAYMEMRVPELLRTTFNKYLAKDGEYLFNFHERDTSANSFGSNVNFGIRKICKSLGIGKEHWYSVYTFRHTWATIAQNDCGASIPEVGFGLNHVRNRITRGYVKIDFTPAWELNEKVIEFIFFTPQKGAREEEQKEKVFEDFTTKEKMRGEVFYKGAMIGKIEDTGFRNVEEIIRILFNYTDDVPQRANLLFRITNIDKQQTAIYERMK